MKIEFILFLYFIFGNFVFWSLILTWQQIHYLKKRQLLAERKIMELELEKYKNKFIGYKGY